MTRPSKADDQLERIRLVLGMTAGEPLPPVCPDTLEVYREHLAKLLDGTPHEGTYQEPGRSRSDRVVLCGISPGVDDASGVAGLLAGESLAGEYPLIGVTLEPGSGFREVVEDYKAWYRRGQSQV